MNVSSLTRTGGIAFIAAGILFIVGYLTHGDNADPNTLQSPLWIVTQMTLLLVYALNGIGMLSLWQVLRSKLGRLGIALVLIDTIPLLIVSFGLAFLLPGIAAQSVPPKSVYQLVGPDGPLPWLSILTLSWLILFVPGMILTGIAIARADWLPRIAGVLIAAGMLIVFVGSGAAGTPQFFFGRLIGVVLLGTGLIWLGHAMRADHQHAVQLQS